MEGSTRSAGFPAPSPASEAPTGTKLTRRSGEDSLPLDVVRRPRSLSFVVESTTKRGRYIDTDFFAVPVTGDYSADKIAGLNAFAEMMAWLSADPNNLYQVAVVLQGVGSSESRVAALSFLDKVADALLYAARYGNWREFVDESIASCLRSQAYMADRRRKEAEEFVARMRAARAAKPAARKEAAHG